VNWDAWGVGVSLACALHCAALPLLVTSLPILGMNIIHNEKFEYFMIFLAFAIGVYALWHGFRRHHHSPLPLLIFGAGMLFLLAKQVWHRHQVPLLLLALALIVTAHFLNYRSCRVHNHGHSDDCAHSTRSEEHTS